MLIGSNGQFTGTRFAENLDVALALGFETRSSKI
jgi:hypothetical protein